MHVEQITEFLFSFFFGNKLTASSMNIDIGMKNHQKKWWRQYVIRTTIV